jgi:hypothetical protein
VPVAHVERDPDSLGAIPRRHRENRFGTPLDDEIPVVLDGHDGTGPEQASGRQGERNVAAAGRPHPLACPASLLPRERERVALRREDRRVSDLRGDHYH